MLFVPLFTAETQRTPRSRRERLNLGHYRTLPVGRSMLTAERAPLRVLVPGELGPNNFLSGLPSELFRTNPTETRRAGRCRGPLLRRRREPNHNDESLRL